MNARVVAAVFAWLLSVAVAGTWGHAAGQQSADEPVIISGDDIGFRITRVTREGARQGTLMVRVDGNWTEVELRPKMAIRPVR